MRSSRPTRRSTSATRQTKTRACFPRRAGRRRRWRARARYPGGARGRRYQLPGGRVDSADRPACGNAWGHGWSSASLGPYRVSGTPPVTVHQAVVASSLAAALGVTRGDRSGSARQAACERSGSPASRPDRLRTSTRCSSRTRPRRSWPARPAGSRGRDLRAAGRRSRQAKTTLARDIGGGVAVLDLANAAQADPGSQVAADRSDLTSSLGVMGASAAMVALFVISSTFAFAVAHRRSETAAMRALGATPGTGAQAGGRRGPARRINRWRGRLAGGTAARRLDRQATGAARGRRPALLKPRSLKP